VEMQRVGRANETGGRALKCRDLKRTDAQHPLQRAPGFLAGRLFIANAA
jgi:hypothetical protein